MLIATHSIAAGVVGEKIGTPVIAFIVGIVIHFILDFIPHYDTTDDGKFTTRQYLLIAAELLLGVYVIFWKLKPPLDLHSSFWWGALGGNLPDILDHCFLWKKGFRKSKFGRRFHQFHETMHLDQPGIILGLLLQVFIIIAFSYIYLH